MTRQGWAKRLKECEQLARDYGEARILAEMVARTLTPEMHACIASVSKEIAEAISKMESSPRSSVTGRE